MLQLGDGLEIRLTLPGRFADGSPMEQIGALEIYMAKAPAKADQLPPAPPETSFYNPANRTASLDAAQVEERKREGRVVLRFALQDLGVSLSDHTGLFWGFILVGPQGQRGLPSPPAGFLSAPPLPAPADLEAASEAEGLRLSFSPPEGAATLRVTRSVGDGIPLLLTDLSGDTGAYLDTSARHGTEYYYAVQAAADPSHWSPAAELRVAYADTFPPETPALVQYLPMAGRAWVKVAPAWGATAYRLYRRCPGEEWTLAAEGPEPLFETDASPCEYGAAAVDASGNQSPIVGARREEP